MYLSIGCLLLLLAPYSRALSSNLTFSVKHVVGNPWTGFLTSPAWVWWDPQAFSRFPTSMDFMYIPMRDLVIGAGQYNWTYMDGMLNDSARRLHHLVFRVYVDYPGRETGVPDYLLPGLTMHPYDDPDVGESPDYTNSTLIDAMVDLIAALGERYDGDPRLAAVQAGLLGFWGEWHTWPQVELMASNEVKQRILETFNSSFTMTPWQTRYPDTNAGTPGTVAGYHDDSFTYSTLGPTSWHFSQLMEDNSDTNKWKSAPIGGEVRPENQLILFDDAFGSESNQESFLECVRETHASWMLNHRAFIPGYANAEKDVALEQVARMGYSIALTSVQASVVELELSLVGELCNYGVAPVYQPLFVDWVPGCGLQPLGINNLSRTDVIAIGGAFYHLSDSSVGDARGPLMPEECTFLSATFTLADSSECSANVHPPQQRPNSLPVVLRLSSPFLLPGQTLSLATEETPSVLEFREAITFTEPPPDIRSPHNTANVASLGAHVLFISNPYEQSFNSASSSLHEHFYLYQ